MTSYLQTITKLVVTVGVSCACAPAVTSQEHKSLSLNDFRFPSGPQMATPASEQALRALESRADELGLVAPRTQLRFAGEHTGAQGLVHIRYDQIEQGIPVWGGHLIVHMDNDGTLVDTNSYLVRLNQIPALRPTLTPAEAGVVARRQKDQDWRVTETTLILYPQERDTRLVFNVVLEKGFFRESYFIDAIDGAVVKRLEGTQSLNR